MLIQEYLWDGGTLASLTKNFGVQLIRSPNDPLVILNYNKNNRYTSRLAGECRGLVIEDHPTARVIARGFPRFSKEKLKGPFKSIQEKVGGTLLLLYNYDNKWRVNTREGFGQEGRLFNLIDENLIQRTCCEFATYVFHEWLDSAYLLTIYYQGEEMSQGSADKIANKLGALRPTQLASLKEARGFAGEIVCCSTNFQRITVKRGGRER
jgi:hypothetical protein